MLEYGVCRRLTAWQGKKLLALLAQGMSLRQAALHIDEAIHDCNRWLEQRAADLRGDRRKVRKENAKYPYERTVYGGRPIGIVEDDRLLESEKAAAAWQGVRFSDAPIAPDVLKRVDIPPTFVTSHCGTDGTRGSATGLRISRA